MTMEEGKEEQGKKCHQREKEKETEKIATDLKVKKILLDVF